MAYDAMGNYTGDYTFDTNVETEEQRRQRLLREQAAQAAAQQPVTPAVTSPVAPPQIQTTPTEPDLANTQVQTQTIKTYGDGSQEHILKTQVPAGAANYNTYTGQQESGNNPNIGYHYPANDQGQRRSTAYGTYGITAPAYRDIQSANPAFANRPLESLTPEEQTQANETYRGVLGKQLQAKGVEPTDENTRLAHLLGAAGAARYLQNRTVSPEAAAANGGQARLQQIADARMAGQPAPASGAAAQSQPQPAPVAPGQPEPPRPEPQAQPPLAAGSPYSLAQGMSQPGLNVPGMGVPLTQGPQLPEAQQRFQDNQDNVAELIAMRSDTSLPEYLRKRSADRAYELLNNDRQKSAAEQRLQDMIAAGDSRGIANALQGRGGKGEEGSFLKMIALGFISPQLAGAEAEKLGLTPTKYEAGAIMNSDGTMTGVEIQRSANGRILGGTHMDGRPLSASELSSAVSGGMSKTSDVSLTPHQAVINGEIHTISTKRTPNGIMYKDDTAGTGWTMKSPEGLQHVGQVDRRQVMADQAAKQAMDAMRRQNTSAQSQGVSARFTEQQILDAGNNARLAVLNGQTSTMPGSTPNATQPAAPATAPGAMPATAPATAPVTAPGAASPIRAQAEAIYAGDQKMPTGMGANNYQNREIRDEVNRIAVERGRPYDPARYDVRMKAEKDFATGKQGDIVRSMNTAIDHMDTARDLITRLPNGQYPLANEIATRFAKNIGDPSVTNFETMRDILAKEVTKAIVANGGTGAERDEAAKKLGNASSPEQLRGALDTYAKLLGGQMTGLKKQAESSGVKSFDSHVTPRTQRVMREAKTTRSDW